MFNSLRTDQLIAGIGVTARTAAGATGAPDDYARGQLLSAYSVSRLLAAEVSGEAALLAWLRAELLDALATAPDDPAAATAATQIEAATDGNEIGGALVDLLADLRSRVRSSPDYLRESANARGGDELRTRIHAILREMASRELAALAARPEGSSKR
ncbi:MAG TPA: hypothetical protein VGC32_03090 [Solirubrobacterales bacterium]